VAQVAAHERHVLVQCTSHKILHLNNLFARLFRKLTMAREVVTFQK
jgi:hypothetical protein